MNANGRILPKIDLHRHLEGSLRLSTMRELALKEGLKLPYEDTTAFRAVFQVTDGEERSLKQFLTKFIWMRRLITCRETLERIAFEAVEDAALDGVCYLELRFNYAQLVLKGLSDREIMEGIRSGVTRGEANYPIHVGLICGISGELSLEWADKAVEFAIINQANGITAVDLMNDERFPPELFVKPFARARDAGLHITVHAGEAAGPESILGAIQMLRAERIGHGTHILEDPKVLALAAERKVLVECCLTSNVQTGAVPSLEAHPLPSLQKAHIPCCLNTDDPGVSNLTLSGEFLLADRILKMGADQMQRMQVEAADYIFRDDLKPWLRSMLEDDDNYRKGAQ